MGNPRELPLWVQASIRATLSKADADYLCRPWTDEDEARYQAEAPSRWMDIDMCAAWTNGRVKARLSDPEITPEDETWPLDPKFSSDSIADWKRANRPGP